MKAKELREKTEKELMDLIKESKEKLRKLRFSLANRQLQNTEEIKKTKVTIARTKTILKERILKK